MVKQCVDRVNLKSAVKTTRLLRAGKSDPTAPSSSAAKPKPTPHEEALLCSIIDDCATDARLIEPLWTSKEEHKRALAVRTSVSGNINGERFDGLSTLSGLPEDFKIHWLSSVSDIPSDTLVLVAKNNDLDRLTTYGTSVNSKQTLPPHYQYKEVAASWMTQRHKDT